MALKNGKINPLNALEIRRVPFPAHHFHFTEIPRYSPTQFQELDFWIYTNLNSRYYIGQAVNLIDNSIVYVTKIGFEQEKELSFFNIACPHLAYR